MHQRQSRAADWLPLIGADDGACKNQWVTQWKEGTQAAAGLQRGDVPEAAGLASALQSVLRGDKRFAIEPLTSPRAPRGGWAVGLAVKRDATDLAKALQAAINELLASGRLAAMFDKSQGDAVARLSERRRQNSSAARSMPNAVRPA